MAKGETKAHNRRERVLAEKIEKDAKAIKKAHKVSKKSKSKGDY